MLKRIIRFIRRYALKGGNVECCLCGKKYLTFLPAGDTIKAHVRCPGCYSNDRNRQLWLTIRPLIADNKNAVNLLHIAPERSISKQLLLLKNIRYTAIDSFEKGYVYPEYVKHMDITSLKFEDNSFHLVLCSHVLEHVSDDKKAMQEIYRVLKQDGTAFIMIPYFPELDHTYEDFNLSTPEERFMHFGQHDHVRKYGVDFVKRLTDTGFEVNVLNTKNHYTDEQIVRLGLLNAELIFQAKKI